MTIDIEELEKAVRSDPGAEQFVELARLIGEDDARRIEARELCFRGLSANPHNKLARLVLARLFYLDNMFEFAARELSELQGTPNAPSLEKLLAEFRVAGAKYLGSEPSKAPAPEPEAVVAEFDIDTDFLEAIDELKEGK